MTHYGPTESEFGLGMDMEVMDEDGILLSQIVRNDRKVKFRYDYDFGDGWQHETVGVKCGVSFLDVSYGLGSRRPPIGWAHCGTSRGDETPNPHHRRPNASPRRKVVGK